MWVSELETASASGRKRLRCLSVVLAKTVCIAWFCRRVRVRSPHSTILIYGYVDEDPLQILRPRFSFLTHIFLTRAIQTIASTVK